ncbi:hypothetical protein H5410_052193, partial [Solanum commersonii]
FCDKKTQGRIFRHKQHLIGSSNIVSKCTKCPEIVREEIKKYVDGKKDCRFVYCFKITKTITKCNSLFKLRINGREGPLDCHFQQKAGEDVGKNVKKNLRHMTKRLLRERIVAAFYGGCTKQASPSIVPIVPTFLEHS